MEASGILLVSAQLRIFVPEHLTRRELKTDNVALSVEHMADYFGLHQRQILQIGGALVIAAILGVGIYFWMDHASTVRAGKLESAMSVSDTPVNAIPGSGVPNYPNQQAKDAAEQKAFSEVASQYAGSREAAVAEYTLAGLAASAGRDDEARKKYQVAADSGNKEYASLARLALAQLDFADNKQADGERLLHELMDHPTAMVSKAQATITLARLISRSRPAEARALLNPLLKESGQVGQAAQAAQSDIPSK